MITVADVQAFLPDLLRATTITLSLTFIAFAIALVLGLVLALGRISTSPIFRIPTTVVVEVIRGTPLVFQLFWVYYVMPFWGVRLEPFPAAVIALSLNYSCYMSEVYRAGIQSIDRGQIEAALSLGMRYRLLMRRIVLPQAIPVVIPPLGNYLISMFKDTSLASIVTLREIMFQGEILAASTFKHVPIFIIAGVIYLLLSYPASLAVQRLERQYKVRRQRALA
ncbi:MAG TPA: ectoine/hydroxyectoine ABC transporter permease subunit EhuD [Chloroflexota bacterium]